MGTVRIEFDSDLSNCLPFDVAYKDLRTNTNPILYREHIRYDRLAAKAVPIIPIRGTPSPGSPPRKLEKFLLERRFPGDYGFSPYLAFHFPDGIQGDLEVNYNAQDREFTVRDTLTGTAGEARRPTRYHRSLAQRGICKMLVKAVFTYHRTTTRSGEIRETVVEVYRRFHGWTRWASRRVSNGRRYAAAGQDHGVRDHPRRVGVDELEQARDFKNKTTRSDLPGGQHNIEFRPSGEEGLVTREQVEQRIRSHGDGDERGPAEQHAVHPDGLFSRLAANDAERATLVDRSRFTSARTPDMQEQEAEGLRRPAVSTVPSDPSPRARAPETHVA